MRPVNYEAIRPASHAATWPQNMLVSASGARSHCLLVLNHNIQPFETYVRFPPEITGCSARRKVD